MARKSRNVGRGGRGRPSKPSSAVFADDIIYMICRYFCSHCNNEYQLPYGPLTGAEKAQDSGTLYNLCLVSRSWRDVAQQTLYHSFHPDYSPPRKRVLKASKNPWKLRLEPFLRTIVSCPDLAGSIQTVVLRDLVIYGLEFYESQRAFDECARALGTSAREIYYKGHHVSAPSEIKQAFFLGTPVSVLPNASTLASEIAGELLTTLVAFLPKLEHLAVEEEYLWGGWRYNVSPISLDTLGVTTIPVKTVEVERPLYHVLSRCTKLDRLFTSGIGKYPKLPNVRYLHLRHTNQFSEGPPNSCIAACSSRLTTLYTADAICAELLDVLHRPRSGKSPVPKFANVYKAERSSPTHESHLQRREPPSSLVSTHEPGLL